MRYFYLILARLVDCLGFVCLPVAWGFSRLRCPIPPRLDHRSPLRGLPILCSHIYPRLAESCWPSRLYSTQCVSRGEIQDLVRSGYSEMNHSSVSRD